MNIIEVSKDENVEQPWVKNGIVKIATIGAVATNCASTQWDFEIFEIFFEINLIRATCHMLG